MDAESAKLIREAVESQARDQAKVILTRVFRAALRELA